MKDESPELTYRQIAIILGQVWQALTNDEKSKYDKLAQKDIERYEREVRLRPDLEPKVKKRKKLRIKPKGKRCFGDKKILLNQKESTATKQFMVELTNYRL